MFLMAVATSIDALAVGITFACVPVEIIAASQLVNTLVAVCLIGVTTFVISCAGVKAGSATMRGSMALRYVLLLVILAFAAKSGRFHPISLLLPLIFVRPLISLGELFRKSGDKPT